MASADSGRESAGHAAADFEGWDSRHDYFSLKEQKLREQTSEKAGAALVSRIFVNAVIHINGRTEPGRAQLWDLIAQNGGHFEQYMRPTVTHIVAGGMQDTQIEKWRRQPAKNRIPVVLPSWITESVERAALQPWRKFLLPRLAEIGQQSVVAAFASPRRPAVPEQQLHRPPTNSSSPSVASAAGGRPEAAVRDEVPGEGIMSTKTDPDFVRKYFGRSRLHHIGTSRGRYQAYVAGVCCNPRRQPAGPGSGGQGRTIVHLDMDCFFASVAVRSRPQLRGQPFVVCFGQTGSKGGGRPVGEISSASYEARKFGVKAGMMGRDAIKLCPALMQAPYEFGLYQEVSDTIYDLFAKAVRHEYGRIEAVSCDEAYLDVTGLDSGHAAIFVQQLRDQVANATSCPCSAGVGPNKLMARLLTAEAKPNGQRLLLHDTADAGQTLEDQVQHYLAELPARQLPGVGYSTAAKLDRLGLGEKPSCGTLRAFSLLVRGRLEHTLSVNIVSSEFLLDVLQKGS